MSQSQLIPFEDRRAAGRQLAERLAAFSDAQPIVLALPRGGVPVGYEIARALTAPLDLALVRKIGAQGHPELGLGAVVDGSAPQMVLNPEIMRALLPSPRYVEAERQRQLAELERRRHLYRGDRPAPDLRDRSVIIVDDGIATGGTIRAVLQAVRQAGAARIVLAVPVAPADVSEQLATQADELVVLATPDPFRAVGAYYRDFTQTTDDEVVALLRSAEAVPDTARRLSGS